MKEGVFKSRCSRLVFTFSKVHHNAPTYRWDAKHYFLYCPSFAALRETLFTSAAQLLGNRWHCASDKKKIDWLLNGISTADFQINVRLFQLVHSFISLSNRFC